jgi:epoxide hydrolase-like predicted phosphatase
MIKAVIFDCFGVLTEDSWHSYRIGLPKGQSLQAQELMHSYSAGFIERSEFISSVSKITARPPEFIEQLIGKETNKNLVILSYIKDLKKKGYKIGLLSNIANNWIRDYFLTKEEQKLFDAMVFSFEAAMTKPDRRIFQLACDKLGVVPEEAILVDDIERYCVAAREIGMQAVWYNDFDRFKTELTKVLST